MLRTAAVPPEQRTGISAVNVGRSGLHRALSYYPRSCGFDAAETFSYKRQGLLYNQGLFPPLCQLSSLATPLKWHLYMHGKKSKFLAWRTPRAPPACSFPHYLSSCLYQHLLLQAVWMTLAFLPQNLCPVPTVSHSAVRHT